MLLIIYYYRQKKLYNWSEVLSRVTVKILYRRVNKIYKRLFYGGNVRGCQSRSKGPAFLLLTDLSQPNVLFLTSGQNIEKMKKRHDPDTSK